MSRLSVDGLAVDIGGVRILDGVSARIAEGSLAVVVGPSGCGKSTLLRAIAGLVRPSAGSIRLDGRTLADPSTFVAPDRRRIGWVPQSPSLFPHLTVSQNIAFGLGGRGRSGRATLPGELLELTGLTELAGRYPDELSGGQAQRVSLARALAAEPGLLLLDEPFAALDPQLRADLRDELAGMLRRLGVTAVLVTHDQGEALLMADSVIVMRDGAVVQQGSAVEVYRAPASAWVAGFLGEANFVPGVADRGRVATVLGEVPVSSDVSGPVTVMLRPEQLKLDPDGIPARVSRVRYGGHDAIVETRTAEELAVLVRVAAGDIPALNDEVGIRVEGSAVLFPAGDSGTAADPRREPRRLA